MNPAELDTGPPEMRRPSWKLGQREGSIERTTIDRYFSAAQLSSPLVRLACAALSREGLGEWICSRGASAKEEICP